ncbi:type II and III secretion system protein family protein [Duganella sp. FT27W]|uniref:type II and III secretion system protein family protein n=1 Tax=Duganella sp. FT27W TaxID=2654636 RepID=UPI00128CE3CD|nr:type II and III secretion system protein family protein [Duganella sp. FT27W]MPQ58866.1 type II and III secretion system protein family protein [Duganella sp. FT27W]
MMIRSSFSLRASAWQLVLAAVLAVPATAFAQPDRANTSLRCAGQAAAPGHLALQLGKSTLMRMPEAVAARSVGNPAVLEAMLVAPDTLYVAGIDIGTSNMIVQGRSGVCNVVEVVVGIDPGALQASLAALMPEQKHIVVTGAGDTLVLSGTASDTQAAGRALELAQAFVRRPARALSAGGEKEGATPTNPTTGAGAGAGTGAAQARVINFLNVGAPQQVMLEVKIAEVSKTLLDKLESGVALGVGGGSWASVLASNFLSGTLRGGLAVGRATGDRFGVQAEKQEGLVRILAEPTVMAISGQEGSFLAGGKILIPVAHDNNKVTLEEKEFGVGVRFTPTVLAGGRINLRVAPEVSELSREGVGISASGFTGAAILPLITTRRAATTVELQDGQSFAIGGLIKNNRTTNINGLPILGELPILGALFRSTDFQHDRTELLFVVTPRLVRPLPVDYQLPTDSVTAPTRTELFLGGKLEGAPPR